MEYSFDIDHAKQYGVDEAIFLKNLIYWIAKNKANEKHLHDGKTWTYNTQKALVSLFPFWSRQNIRTIIKSLIDQNVILTHNYNDNASDRTTWYALVDEANLLQSFTGETPLVEDDSLGWNQPKAGLESTNIKGTDSKPYSKRKDTLLQSSQLRSIDPKSHSETNQGRVFNSPFKSKKKDPFAYTYTLEDHVKFHTDNEVPSCEYCMAMNTDLPNP